MIIQTFRKHYMAIAIPFWWEAPESEEHTCSKRPELWPWGSDLSCESLVNQGKTEELGILQSQPKRGKLPCCEHQKMSPAPHFDFPLLPVSLGRRSHKIDRWNGSDQCLEMVLLLWGHMERLGSTKMPRWYFVPPKDDIGGGQACLWPSVQTGIQVPHKLTCYLLTPV